MYGYTHYIHFHRMFMIHHAILKLLFKLEIKLKCNKLTKNLMKTKCGIIKR